MSNETPKNNVDTEVDINNSKQVEFFSQGLAAWFNSALERDKSLLTLSVAGIGFLVSQMQTGIISIHLLIIYIVAILAFSICLISVLITFSINKKYIQDLFSNKKESKYNFILSLLDGFSIYSFMVAMLLCVMLGISSAVFNFVEKGNKVENKNNTQSNRNLLQENFQGLEELTTGLENFKDLEELRTAMINNGNQTQPPQPTASQPTASQPTASQPTASQPTDSNK